MNNFEVKFPGAGRGNRIGRNAFCSLVFFVTAFLLMGASSKDATQEPPLMPGLDFQAESGLIEAPFVIESGSLSQSIRTYDPNIGGRARWRVRIPKAGFYTVSASVKAPSSAENSFFIDWDKESFPVTWDIPVTRGFEPRVARWVDQNTGIWDPRIWELTKGVHTLILRGREPNVLIESIRVEEHTGETRRTTKQAKEMLETLALLSDETVFRTHSGQRQLFLDDYGIAQFENLERTMHQPTKKGAVIRPDLPWEDHIQARSKPVWDPAVKRFKLWLLLQGTTSGVSESAYAESEDGIHWTKPILRQKGIQGSLENNIITVDPILEWPANAIMNVVSDPDDPDPSRRFKGLLGIVGRKPIVSPDGIHWKRLDVPALPSSDESNLSYDRQAGIFIATLKWGGPYGRSQSIWVSKDFEAWTCLEAMIHADELDQKLGAENMRARLADPTLHHPPTIDPANCRVDVYNFGVFRYEGLYIGLPAMFHRNRSDKIEGDIGFHLVQLASSRDLKNWKRLGDRKTFIGPSTVASGAYDLTQILPPSGPVVRGDELWFYYLGEKYRGPPPEDDRHTGAVCLAVLRRDGFISMNADKKEGTLLTKPFTVSGKKLFVNVDAAGGELRAEVLGKDGAVLAISAPVKGDQPRGKVQWRKGNMADFKGEEVSIRFTLRNAAFYSYWLY